MAPIMSESFQRSANTRLPFAFRLSCCWVFRRWFRLGLFFMLYQWSPGGNLLFIRPLHLALSAHSIHDSRHPWTIFAIVHEAPSVARPVGGILQIFLHLSAKAHAMFMFIIR